MDHGDGGVSSNHFCLCCKYFSVGCAYALHTQYDRNSSSHLLIHILHP